MPHVIKMHYKSSMKQKQQVLFRNIIVETSFSREMFKNFINCLRNVKESALFGAVHICTYVYLCAQVVKKIRTAFLLI